MVQWLAPWTLNPVIRVRISVGPSFLTSLNKYKLIYSLKMDSVSQQSHLAVPQLTSNFGTLSNKKDDKCIDF